MKQKNIYKFNICLMVQGFTDQIERQMTVFINKAMNQ